MADFKQLIADAVKKYNLPPEWADIGHRQMMAESGGNPTAVSPAGAQGLMQFMPKTAKGYGLQNPNDPVQSVDAWARMTADLINQTGGKPMPLTSTARMAPITTVPTSPKMPVCVGTFAASRRANSVDSASVVVSKSLAFSRAARPL